jgi:hypothetical protein
MNDFPKTASALRELRVACRQLACANLRARLNRRNYQFK